MNEESQVSDPSVPNGVYRFRFLPLFLLSYVVLTLSGLLGYLAVVILSPDLSWALAFLRYSMPTMLLLTIPLSAATFPFFLIYNFSFKVDAKGLHWNCYVGRRQFLKWEEIVSVKKSRFFSMLGMPTYYLVRRDGGRSVPLELWFRNQESLFDAIQHYSPADSPVRTLIK